MTSHVEQPTVQCYS